MDEYPELVALLDDLIKTVKDGEEGYVEAAKDVESDILRALFIELSTQRAQVREELQQLARSYGDRHPETDGSALAVAHRGWIELRSSLASKNGHAILDECVRGEDSAINAFSKALEGELPILIRNALSTAFEQIREARNRIGDLRKTWSEVP